MNRLLSCSVAMSIASSLVSLAVVLLNSSFASAQTVNINHTDRGHYNELGQHFTTNQNYFVGENRGFGCEVCLADSRNFFVFDLSSVVTPIASAKLALFVPVQGFDSNDGKEAYELHDVGTPIATLLDGTGGVAAHTDLGSGVVYGVRSMSAADMGSVVEITLSSSAIAAMNSNHGLFGIGGSIISLDELPNNEYTFAGTSLGTEVTQLRLTLVPEPSTLLLLGIGAISLLGRRKAKSYG
jgi:hypothetical protein